MNRKFNKTHSLTCSFTCQSILPSNQPTILHLTNIDVPGAVPGAGLRVINKMKTLQLCIDLYSNREADI